MTEKKSTSITPTDDHEAKKLAVAEAITALEAAIQAKARAGAKILDAPDAGLDAAIAASVTADAKVAACQRRLDAAREREVAAAEAVKAASVDEAQAELVNAEAQLASQDATAMALVRDFLASIAAPLADLLAARDARDALVSRITALGASANAANPGPASKALRVGVPDAKAAIALIRAGTLVEPTINVFDTVTSVISWVASEPKREAEAKERAEQVIRNRAAQRHADALAGKLGEEERDAALLKERIGFANFVGKPSATSASNLFAAQAIATRTLPAIDEAP